MSFAAQTLSPTCVVFSKKSSGTILEFRCIMGRTKCGTKLGLDAMTGSATHRRSDNNCVRDDPSLLNSLQGMKVFGTLLGHSDTAQAQLRSGTRRCNAMPSVPIWSPIPDAAGSDESPVFH